MVIIVKKKTNGYVAIIAAFFIPLIFSLFYLNMYVSEINHNRMVFENAVKQTALRVARQRLHHLDGNQEQTNHLNRIAAITFNDWMKVKSSIDKNIFSIKVNDVTYGAKQRSEFRHYSSKNGGFYSWCSQRHWLWSNYVEDFYDNYDPDGERVVDYVSVNDSSSDFNAEGYALSNLMTGAPSITKTICQSTTSNIKITNDDNENIQVEATAKFGKYNKTYKATYKASPPKLNADIVLCIPVNSAACNTCNDPYATEDQIDNLYSNSTDYYHNAARDTPIWQIKTAFRQFMRQIIGYTECGVGIIPYSGNVAIHGWHYFDEKTIPFDGFHYANYDAVNPQVPVAESFKFATHEDYHLSINKDKEHANWGPSQRSFTPLIYRSDINGMLESYMNDNSDGSDVLKSLYSLVDQKTNFMRRAVDINPCGNINVLAGYSIRKENSYPHPYPMLGIINKTSEPYRYLTTFMPFADHSNKSNFLYLPLMFGASMLLNGFGELNYYNVENAKNRKKCLILVDNMGDLFAPHELTYFGMSNDASYLTLVNGERLDYESGDLELVDGYYQNKIHDCSNKTHSERIAIKCNYTKDSTNDTYELKTPQPGNIKIVVQTVDNQQVHAKLSQDNLHAPDVKISSVTKADGDEALAITDNYYTCNLNTSYKITFENIENRKSPVIARLELIGCEIESLVSLDNKYVLRQDENYVYICYGDDAYTNGIESCDSSLDQNTVIIKFKHATEVTDYLTLSYVGQAFLDSSVYFSPGTQTYVLGNVYNAVLDGSMNIDGNISSSYNQNWKNVFYTGYSQYYCPESIVYYSNNKYDVEELCRLCLSNVELPDILQDPWKELASDWVYGNENWNGFSDISYSSTLNGINAEYGGGDNLAPNHSPEGESFPQIKVYKTNQYNNVVVNDVYTYTEGCFVADMGDYFNIYSILGNHPSLDITISNPDKVKSVYAQIETFGFDIDIEESSEDVSWGQDDTYIYMCYKNDISYDDDNRTSISIVTQESDRDTGFIETNNIDGLFPKPPNVTGCTCGNGTVNGNKYIHTIIKDLTPGSVECTLFGVNDCNINGAYFLDEYNESITPFAATSNDICHGISVVSKIEINIGAGHEYDSGYNQFEYKDNFSSKLIISGKNLTITPCQCGNCIQTLKCYCGGCKGECSGAITDYNGKCNCGNCKSMFGLACNCVVCQGKCGGIFDYSIMKCNCDNCKGLEIRLCNCTGCNGECNGQLNSNGKCSCENCTSQLKTSILCNCNGCNGWCGGTVDGDKCNCGSCEGLNAVNVCNCCGCNGWCGGTVNGNECNCGSCMGTLLLKCNCSGCNGECNKYYNSNECSNCGDCATTISVCKCDACKGKCGGSVDSNGCNCGQCIANTVDREFEHCINSYSEESYQSCNFSVKNAESFRRLYNNKEYHSGDNQYGLTDWFHSIYITKSDVAIFSYGNESFDVNVYGQSLKSIMTITPNIQKTTTQRTYKSAENGDKIPVPYAIVYKKPGHYVSSEEGNALTDEYETVDSVYISDSSLPACILESSNIDGANNAGWKCYAPDGLTYNTEKKEWELNADRLSSKYTINFINDVPYPVLAKIKCFNVAISESENNADDQDNVLIRQDGEYYYVCNRTSVNTELNDGISTADISFYPSTDLKEYKKLPLSYANMRLLSAGDTDSESFTFIPKTKNQYVVYRYNCNLNASASYSDTINNNSYTIDNLVTGLNVYASHVVSNSKTYSGCTYHDYFLSYKDTPDDAIFDSSAIISSISASKYQDKHREFKTTDASYNITLNSSKPSYSTSYTLTSGYNVIYIPRQGDKDTTWDSTDTFDLNIGLNNAKICSIEWSNHLNGTEGCYPCDSSDGYGATDDSGNLAVYYEPIKKGKNCRWVDCTLNEQEKKEDSSDFKLTNGNIVVGSFDYGISETPFLWKSTNNESDVFDSGIYKDLTGIWHLKGFNRDDKRVAIFAEINESAVSHGDFNFILNNAYGVSNVDVWFAHHYKSYENKERVENKDGSPIYQYSYMNGVGRYFQPTHTNAYNMLNGFDSITLCARIDTPADQLILSSIECTNEVNRILMASGIQSLDSSDLPNMSPTQALKEVVTPNMIKTVKSELGANGRIYVVHYRKEGQDEDPNTLHLDNYDSSNDISAVDSDSGCQIIDYGARNLDELNKVMSDILTDIKKFAGSTDAQIIE